MTRSRLQSMSATLMAVVVVLMWVLSCGNVAAADIYADSAHGNASYGVNRTGTECPPGTLCPTGECVHCHETFDPSICGVNSLMLFYDYYVSRSDMLCFQCHRTGDLGYGVVENEPYCVNFGGRSSISAYNSIKREFTNDNSKPAACGSRHTLNRVQFIIKDNKNGWGFDSNPIPCLACHPSHAAQRSHHPVAIDGEGKLNTAIRRALHYKSTDPADLLWGDDANERMSYYATSNGATYQAPYYGYTTTTFEPSGNSSPSDGSDLPDYVTFCLDCHEVEQYDPDCDRTVKAIDWSEETGDRHGLYPANDCTPGMALYEGTLKPPYVDTPNSNYVLSCLDCHEPHGSRKRLHLIRRMINGQEVLATFTGSLYYYCDDGPSSTEICEKCHNIDTPASHRTGDCRTCHGDGGISPYEEWSFHGGSDDAAGGCQGKPMF